ncbi:hypothetical protein ACFX2I_011959 [Malus domestica]
MYAAEALGKFSVFRETPASMAAMNHLRGPVRIRPMSQNFISSKNLLWNHGMKCQCSSGGGSVDEKSAFSVTSSSKYEVDYLGEKTKGDLNVKVEHLEAFGIDGDVTLKGPIEEVARVEAEEAGDLLRDLGIPSPFSSRQSPRGIFCSRTLNLRSISAIGYDMDYTLMHYNVIAWEGRAYDYCMENLKKVGFPVDGLAFDPDLVIRGLVIDKEKGNLVKPDRFGYVKRAMHGTTMLSNRAVSEMYGRELVDLRKETRWEFLNTLFSVSEAVAYMQMVDRLDDGTIAAEIGPLDYKGLYKAVGRALFRAHVEGQLKSEIMSKPELFVEPDPELPLALLDQKEAGKKLLLITNSDYHYTNKMMQHSFNRFLPNEMGWRDLFDIVIVSARKPEFFQMSHPMYEVVTGEGLMRPCFKAKTGGLYSGGSAQMVENSLNIHGDEILYVGDHIYTDVSQSKVHLRWRTALVCRELEEEYSALILSGGHRAALVDLINQKEVVGDLFNQLRLASQRQTKGRPAQTLAATNLEDQELSESMQKLLIVMQRLDQKIAPMLEADGELFNKRWGFLSRAGFWDKSHLMRQIEKYADIYTSRVSNFLHYTPFMYFRSQEQTLAHDSYSYYCSRFNGPAMDDEIKWVKKKRQKLKTRSNLEMEMKKLRWAMDGSFWDLDVSTPRTLDGLVRPVPGDPLPLGLTRGPRLSRPKQIDFMQRFMASIFVPSYTAADGFTLQRVLTLPIGENWFGTILGQFNFQRFISAVKKSGKEAPPDSVSSWMQSIGTHLREKSLYALSFCSEFWLTADDTLVLSVDGYGDDKKPRKKALFQHKFSHHNLTVEAVWPGLFADKPGNYWDVPFSMSLDLASVASDSGASYRVCARHNSGTPERFDGGQSDGVPVTLLPGLSVTSAFSFKKNFELWRSHAQKLRMVQPFDVFLSNPHVSASGIIGAVMTASFGDSWVRSQIADDDPQGFRGFSFWAPGVKSAFLADIFASATFTAQHGNFQRLFLDLSRFHARLDFPSGSKFLSGAAHLAQDYFNSQQPNLEAIQDICPNATLSLQQQICGPVSFRVESGVAVELKNRDWNIRVDEPVFALEYALQVLGSAKAVAWYSPKHQECMIELRFYET